MTSSSSTSTSSSSTNDGTMTITTPSPLSRLQFWALPFVHFFLASIITIHHVQAENLSVDDGTNGDEKMTTWQRLVISGPKDWTSLDIILFCALVMLGMEFLGWSVRNSGAWMNPKLIPVRGKHLDVLTSTDRLFIGLSKAQTGPFVYFLLRYCYFESNILWSISDMSVQTLIVPGPLFYIVFDFFYTIMHWALHIKAIYGYIHKHHHTQKAPSRANDDAINVHPIEFFLGEYNHLWSFYLCCHVFGVRIHIIGVFLYIVAGGILAGLNHTRYDLSFQVFGITLFDTKVHDVHHRIPQSNYGQYTMFWDHVFGSFRPYNPKDRINPKAQLDPKSGMSIEYIKSRNLHEQ